MDRLSELLQVYGKEQFKRATGGLYSLSGFDFQLRCYLADFVQALNSDNEIEKAGEHFLEAFSDFTRQTASELVCVQVKRTLTAKSLKDAATEAAIIQRFFEKHDPDLERKAKFQILGQRHEFKELSSELFDSIDLGDPELQSALSILCGTKRMLPPRIEADPWWRMIAAVFPLLDDPFAFGNEALEVCLRRGVRPEDAEGVRNEIAQIFARRRLRVTRLPGRWMTPKQLEPAKTQSKEIILGEVPTTRHLCEGRFMERPASLAAALAELDRHLAAREQQVDPRIHAFWIVGRSGNGKSVLLLQLMRELVCSRGANVVWLDDASSALLPVLNAWRSQDENEKGLLFVFVDDFYAPHKRDSVDFAAVARLARENDSVRLPVLVTCGPPEQIMEFQASGDKDAFRVHQWRLPPSGQAEKVRLRQWFAQRTGVAPNTGEAFEQQEGLMISMLFEMRKGDLTEFGRRFRKRLEAANLAEALVLPLALNRLYIWAPRQWLTEEQKDALRLINDDKDFISLSLEGAGGNYLRLTHPHLSDFIYRALRPLADAIVFTRDLTKAFSMALESNPRIAARILYQVAQGHERLAVLDQRDLARGMAEAWSSQSDIEQKFDQIHLARIWTNWALWGSREPEVGLRLGKGVALARAREHLRDEHPDWGILWNALWKTAPGDSVMEQAAHKWLANPAAQLTRQWSPVWQALFEYCFKRNHIADPELLSAGLAWLNAMQFEPDWNYVFRAIANHAPDQAPLELAMRVMRQPENTNWAFVCDAATHLHVKLNREERVEIHRLAANWLEKREDRDEWAYVWARLVESRADLGAADVELGELLKRGYEWLEKREERDEWSYVWARLVESQADLGAADVELGELLKRGYEWLKKREERDEWAHVWARLVESRADLGAAGVELGELLKGGFEWLEKREERDEWSYVWRRLVESRANLGAADVELGELLKRGYEWLEKREERDEWSYVWARLVESRADLGTTDVELGKLLKRGYEWLEKREERDEWAHVWERLMESRADLGVAGIEFGELLKRGYEWLDGHEMRDDWTHIWETLMQNCEKLKEAGLDGAMLVQKGLEWLKGREDRFDWAPVWEKLIENPLGLKGPGLDTGSLLALGVAWLDGRQARSDWSFVYETALKQGVCDEHFLEMGVIWCRSNAKRPETWGIAQELLIAFNQEANDMIRHSFIDWVAKELESRPTHKSWTFLWGALWRIDPTPNTLNLALLWIEHIPPDRQVTWVLNTALGPSTPAVLETAVQWCVAHPSLRSSWSAAVILLRAYVPKANDVPQQFKNWVANILKQSPENPSWTSVWGALREVEPTIETAKLIIPWLANASKPAPITWAVRTLLKSSEGELMRAELERWVVENPSQYAASVIKSALSAAARESLRDCKNAPDAEKDAELL